MTFTMTERDKKLLMLVSCAVVILICVQYLILPAIENKQNLEAEREELTFKQEEWKLQIGKLDYLTKSIEDNRTARDTASAPYYKALETREMDSIITNLAIKHGLFPQSLNLNDAAPGVVADYVFFTPPTNRDLRSSGYVKLGTATLEVHGTTEQWTSFMDAIIAEHPGLRVTNFSMDEIVYVNMAQETVRTQRIISTIEIYMCVAEEEVAK